MDPTSSDNNSNRQTVLAQAEAVVALRANVTLFAASMGESRVDGDRSGVVVAKKKE